MFATFSLSFFATSPLVVAVFSTVIISAFASAAVSASSFSRELYIDEATVHLKIGKGAHHQIGKIGIGIEERETVLYIYFENIITT